MRSAILALTLVALAWPLIHGAPQSATEAKVEVTRLLIARPTTLEPKKDAGHRGSSNPMFMEEGVAISLAVTVPGQTILQLDRERSSLKLTDDQGTTLKPGTEFDRRTIHFDPKVSDDQKLLQITVGSEQVPSQQARTIRLEGQLSILCGEGKETSPVLNLPLKKGQRVEAGPVKVNLAEVEDASEDNRKGKRVTLGLGQQGHLIEKLEFLDQGGQPIKSSMEGRMTFNKDESRFYFVETTTDALRLRVTYFTKSTTVTAPLQLAVSVGL
ncbi:MAG TPA: hypothetical protein PKD86_10095 [Gemmatales bacterium]|nr:hypothetical protein [Gemmatales bacterium]HMP59694.1 hypothetical protein [Gemmatales bacterium]